MKYAKGKYAKAVCARSGFRVPYRHLVKDGYDPSLWVLRSDRDPIQPIEDKNRNRPLIDGISLHHPQPETSTFSADAYIPSYDTDVGAFSPPLTVVLSMAGTSQGALLETVDNMDFLTADHMELLVSYG